VKLCVATFVWMAPNCVMTATAATATTATLPADGKRARAETEFSRLMSSVMLEKTTPTLGPQIRNAAPPAKASHPTAATGWLPSRTKRATRGWRMAQETDCAMASADSPRRVNFVDSTLLESQRNSCARPAPHVAPGTCRNAPLSLLAGRNQTRIPKRQRPHMVDLRPNERYRLTFEPSNELSSL
jgi:hypothetical protein